jgi:hypothetical protein
MTSNRDVIRATLIFIYFIISAKLNYFQNLDNTIEKFTPLFDLIDFSPIEKDGKVQKVELF